MSMIMEKLRGKLQFIVDDSETKWGKVFDYTIQTFIVISLNRYTCHNSLLYWF